MSERGTHAYRSEDMKLQSFIAWAAILGTAAVAQADIIDAYCTADEEAIVMEGWSWQWFEEESTARMWVYEVQKLPVGRPYPSFIADSDLDPYAYIIKEVENDTTFDWTDYHIDLILNKTFEIVSVGQPVGWVTPVVTQPTEVEPGVWVGAVDYYYGGPGTEILIGGTATYDVKVSFAGTANFTVEQVPTPEPATVGLLALGTLTLLRRRR
jgi:hypothetical protein